MAGGAAAGKLKMQDLTAKIKEIDLPGLARDYGVELVSHGETLTGLCPFHSEKNPSFKINQNRFGKWRFYCFG